MFLRNLILLTWLLCCVKSGFCDSAESNIPTRHNDVKVKSFIEATEHVFNTYSRKDILIYLDEAEKKNNIEKIDKINEEIWYYRQLQKARDMGDKPALEVMEPLMQAIEIAKKRKWAYIEAKLHTNAGIYLIGRDHTAKAFEHFVKACKLIQDIGLDKYPEAILMLNKIAENYYLFGDYDNSITWMKMCLSVREPWLSIRTMHEHINTLALCYQAKMQYDSAIYYFQLAHERAVKDGNTFWATLTNGNKGYCYYLNGNTDEALELLIPDFKNSQREKETISAVNAALAIASIYVQKKNINAAGPYLEYARENVTGMNPKSKANYFKSVAEISKYKNQWALACQQLDSFIFYKKIADDISDNRFIKNAEAKVAIEKHEHELALLEEKKSKEILLRNGLLIMLLLIGIITGLIFNRKQLDRKKKLEKAEWDKKTALNELENSKHELNYFTKALREKNELIQSIRQELSRIRSSDADGDRISHINSLLNSSILTDDDWKQFRQLFEKVHPGFLVRLKEKYPELSPAETRLIVLIKLDVSQKEMADMLGVGYDSIRKTKQRLRQKLQIGVEDNLQEILNQI